MSYFRVFGYVCYVFIPDILRRKLDKKVIHCVFLGLKCAKKGMEMLQSLSHVCGIAAIAYHHPFIIGCGMSIYCGKYGETRNSLSLSSEK